MIKIAPSLLAANFAALEDEVKSIEKCGADWLHLDIMDGHFVPNISFGPGVVKALRSKSNLFFDVHLMISDPVTYSPEFAEAGADLITFHAEAVDDLADTVEKIKGTGVKVGVSVKPKTDVTVLADILDKIDLVLIMSVEPGFGGQKFMPDVLNKAQWLCGEREKRGLDFTIEIDGGINRDTAHLAVESGVDVLVAGTAIFRKENIKGEIDYYHSL